MIHQRSILEKWGISLDRKSDIHSAGLVLPMNNWEMFDPFLVMAEDVMKKGAFDYHPHRGIETVTYLLDGELSHFDNAGNADNLEVGDVQWMNSGKGIIHLEEAPEGKTAHTLQLWVNLPADRKFSAPYYQNLKSGNMPVIRGKGFEKKLFSGTSGDIISATKNNAQIKMLEIKIDKGQTVSEILPPDYNGFIIVMKGEGLFGQEKLVAKSREVMWLKHEKEESEITISTTDSSVTFLLFAGKPLREPVVAGGPFVMNTEEQIKEAYQDFKAGKFDNL